MDKGITPNSKRKQAEAEILKHMRAILGRLKSTPAKAKVPSNQSIEPIDREHVLSVVSRFTNLKKTTKH